MGIQLPQPTLSSLGGVPETREIIAGANMTGGGTLNNDVTLNSSGGGGGNWWFVPPLASDFPNVGVGAGGNGFVTISDDADAGLLVASGVPVAGNISAWARFNVSGDWVATMKMSTLIPDGDFLSFGMTTFCGTFNRAYNFHALNTPGGLAIKWGGPTNEAGANQYPYQDTVSWLRIEKSGSTLYFFVSNNGKLWTEIQSFGLNHWFGNVDPSEVGFSVQYDKVGGLPTNTAIEYWNFA